jgi:hypothetical protein
VIKPEIKTYCLLLLFAMNTLIAFGQSNKDLERGNAYYSVGQYINAAKYYQLGRRKGNMEYVYHRLAKCYRKLGQPDQAVYYLMKLKSKAILSETQRVDLGMMLKMTGRYTEAKKEFNFLSLKYPDKAKYKSCLMSCDSALLWGNAKTQKIKIENLATINTSFSEISPYWSNESLIFSSNREDFIIKNRPGGEELPFYDLFIASSKNKEKEGNPRPFASVINTSTHESSVAFNASGDKVYFTQHSDKTKDSSGSCARLKIFYLENIKGTWKNPHTFIFNDSSSSFAHPYLSKDGKLFFFVSDMKGGLGGTDIYFCLKKDSLWSLPINMGAPVNTEGNEIFPFYFDETQVLYFASDTHIGMGGYDIFEAVQNGDDLVIRNMKPPINSCNDDFGIFFHQPDDGYFVSNRPSGKGLEDIYKFFVADK